MKAAIISLVLLVCISISFAESIKCTVVDANNEQPVRDVKVWLDSVNFCFTDAAGEFTFNPDENKDTTMIILEHPSYLTAARSTISLPGNPTTLLYVNPDNITNKKNEVSEFGPLETGLKHKKTDSKNDSVLTPSGKRIHKSKLFKIFRNQSVDFSDNRIRILDKSNRVVEELGSYKKGKKTSNIVPDDTGWWVTSAWWYNTTGSPTKEFVSAWMVPQLPSTANDGCLFLFNGMQNEDTAYAWILQPVMQYGDNGEFGGNYWVVASWYVHNGENRYVSDYVVLTPGDVIVGKMERTGTTGSNYNYHCSFIGLPQTNLQIDGVEELVHNCLALEFWYGDCDRYPRCDYMTYFNTYLSTGNGSTWPSISWFPYDDPYHHLCNERTRILKNGNFNAAVSISWYNDHFIFADPQNSGCTSYDWYKGDVNSSNTISYSSTSSGFLPTERVRLAMSRAAGKVVAVAPSNKIQVGNVSSSGAVTWSSSTTIPNIQGVDEVLMDDYGFIVVFYVNSSGIPLYTTGYLSPSSNNVTWFNYNVQFKLNGDITVYAQPGGNFFAADFGSSDDLRIGLLWKAKDQNTIYYYNAYYNSQTNLIVCDQTSLPQMQPGTLLNLDIAYNRTGVAFIVQNELNTSGGVSSYNTWVATRKDGSSIGSSYLKISNRRAGRIGGALDNGLIFSKASSDKTGYLDLVQSNHPNQPTIISTSNMGSCKRVDIDPLHCDIAF